MDGPDETCSDDQKRCGGSCVSRSDPEYGCGATSCDACNEREDGVHFGESYACSATGACELVDCNSGSSIGGMRENCDGSLANGCEVDLGDDPLNCGACGNVCPEDPPVGATDTVCRSGSCAPTCTLGRSDADGVLENGCEMTMQFVVGHHCPPAVPVEGAQCEYLDIEGCAYFTPGGRCVTRAACGFVSLTNSPWIVHDEVCDGRRDGEFCEVDEECASYKCTDFACASGNGGSCTMDEGCASNSCCPTATMGSYSCQLSCTLAEVGAACTWGAQCATGVCDGAVCGACPDADCTAALCGSRECGSVSGVACGTCPSTEYCNAGICQDPCAEVECGDSHGFDCGGCTDQDYCNAGVCEDACAEVECGDSHGVDCGGCTGTDYCNAGVCADACAHVECGENEGIDCGTCAGETELCQGGECNDVCQGLECGEQEGIDCGSCGVDEACNEHSCEPLICPLEQDYYCKEGDVWRCYGGTSESIQDVCTEEQFCLDGDSTCNPRCSEGEGACINGVHGTCAADGISLEGESRDCEGELLTCSPSDGCGYLHQDTHASSSCVDSYDFVGNVYEVSGDRTLLNFGMYVSLPTTGDATLSVYTGTSEDGPFTLADSHTYSAVGQGVLSRPFELEVTDGAFVVLGVTVATADGFACHGASPNTASLSFGRSTGKGYLLAANPGSTIAVAPTAVTSYASMVSFVPD